MGADWARPGWCQPDLPRASDRCSGSRAPAAHRALRCVPQADHLGADAHGRVSAPGLCYRRVHRCQRGDWMGSLGGTGAGLLHRWAQLSRAQGSHTRPAGLLAAVAPGGSDCARAFYEWPRLSHGRWPPYRRAGALGRVRPAPILVGSETEHRPGGLLALGWDRVGGLVGCGRCAPSTRLRIHCPLLIGVAAPARRAGYLKFRRAELHEAHGLAGTRLSVASRSLALRLVSWLLVSDVSLALRAWSFVLHLGARHRRASS